MLRFIVCLGLLTTILSMTNTQSIPNRLEFEAKYVPDNSLFARKVLGYDNRNKEVSRGNRWQDTIRNYDYYDFLPTQKYAENKYRYNY
ncbi:hypothetical protein Trydic_g11559 [Trypoxylus dichotomus]